MNQFGDLDTLRALNAVLFAVAGITFLFISIVGHAATAPRAQRARYAALTLTCLSVSFVHVTAARAIGDIPPPTIGTYCMTATGIVCCLAAVMSVTDRN